MKIIWHVGMGKTGTSSIQKALSQSADVLAQNDVDYLGMWFDILGPDYAGQPGIAKLLRAPEDEQRAQAAIFAQALRERGAETYIWSNEAAFGFIRSMGPFMHALEAEGIDMRYLVYVRRPHDWLPSAFTQWNIFHKQQTGPVQPFSERARTLVAIYGGIRGWTAEFGDRVTFLPFDKSTDVVADFSRVLGIELAKLDQRALERTEPAETVLRALFNDRFDDPILPTQFTNTVLQGRRGSIPSIDRMIELCFDHDATDEIVQEHRSMFDEIEGITGIDLRLDEIPAAKVADREEIRDRLMDYMMEIMLQQSVNIRRLSREIRELRDGD